MSDASHRNSHRPVPEAARMAPPAPDCVHLWTFAAEAPAGPPAPDGTRPVSYSRRTLRTLLGLYPGCAPEQVPLRVGDTGKPELAITGDAAPLQFNTSHSGALLVHAFSTRPLGIDVERIDEHLPWTLARQFLSPSEFAALERAAPSARRHCFYAAWARKEAYIKAHACRRLSHQFEVSLAPAARQALISDRADPLAPLRWTVADLQLMEGYAAALAIQGPQPRIEHCEAATFARATVAHDILVT